MMFEYVAMLAVSGVMVALLVVLWKMTTALVSTSGDRLRASDRERRDRDTLIVQLVEKASVTREDWDTKLRLAGQHGNERGQKMQADAQLEAAAIGSNRPAIPQPRDTGPEFCEPHEVVDE